MVGSRLLLPVFVCLALLMAVGMLGCSSSPPPEPLPEPGLTGNDDGTATAVGVLVYVDLEGGFWRIAQTAAPSRATDAPSVVVIANAGQIEAGLESLEGEYVRAVGALYDGASIRMAGQEMIVETIEPLVTQQ